MVVQYLPVTLQPRPEALTAYTTSPLRGAPPAEDPRGRQPGIQVVTFLPEAMSGVPLPKTTPVTH